MEFENFGWNLATVGFVGALLTSSLGMWGVWRQYRAIREDTSGESVSVVMFAYGVLFFAVGGAYGITIGSAALIFSGLRSFLHLPVLSALWKHKGFTRVEVIVCGVLLAALAATLALPHKDWSYLVISIGAVVSFLSQPYEIWRNRSAGKVSAWFLWSMFIGVGFWTVYGLAIGNWVLNLTNPPLLAIVILTLVLWHVYRHPRAK